MTVRMGCSVFPITFAAHSEIGYCSIGKRELKFVIHDAAYIFLCAFRAFSSYLPNPFPRALRSTTSAIAPPTTKNAPPAGAVPMLIKRRFGALSLSNVAR